MTIVFYQRSLSGDPSDCFPGKAICYDCRVVVTWLPCRVKSTAREFSAEDPDLIRGLQFPEKIKTSKMNGRNRTGDHRSQASEWKAGRRAGRGGGRAQQRQTGWWSKSENDSASEGRWRVQREEQGRGSLRRNVALHEEGGYEFLLFHLCAFRCARRLFDEDNK